MIDVVIPAHPARERNGMLARAVASVEAQTVPAHPIVVMDTDGAGSATTRTRGLAEVRSPWVAFLDSDDELDPDHLKWCASYLYGSGADVAYPWFHVEGYPDPWPWRFGRPFHAGELRRSNYIPVTVVARTAVVRAAGGFRADLTIAPPAQCDEWGLWLRMLDQGATFVHVPVRTWTWRRHRGNTAGSPLLGDAKVRGARSGRHRG